MAIFGSDPNALINKPGVFPVGTPIPNVSNAPPPWMAQIQNMMANFHPWQPPGQGVGGANPNMGLMQYMQHPQLPTGWGNYTPNLVGQNMPGFNFHPMMQGQPQGGMPSQPPMFKPAATNGTGWT